MVALQWHPLLLVYLPAALASAITAMIAWRHRRTTPAALGLAVSMTAHTLWALADGAVFGVREPRLAAALGSTVALWAAVTCAGFFTIALALVRRDWRPTPRYLALIGIQPVLVALTTVFRPDWIGDPMTRAGLPLALAWHPGPAFWLHTGYSYALLGLGGVIILRAWVHLPGVYRRQLSSVLSSVALPFAANVAALIGLTQGRSLEITPFLFAVTGALNAYAILRQGLFELMPVARELVLDTIDDAVLVLDHEGRVLDLNPSAEALLRTLHPGLPDQVIGLPSDRIRLTAADDGGFDAGERQLDVDARAVDLDVRTTPLTDRHGAQVGRVVVIRDVSELHAQRRALAETNRRLTEQLHTIERLRAELAEQAVRDVLTGLYNRRHLMVALDEEISRATRAAGPLSVVMVDLDHFKTINDRHGHAVGDEVLALTGRILAGAVRQHDVLARYGGEEFVAVLPGSTLDDAVACAERWRRLLRDGSANARRGPARVTLSAGVATLPAGGGSAQALLEAADQALYAAKAAGRDRVVAAPARRIEEAATAAPGGGRAGL